MHEGLVWHAFVLSGGRLFGYLYIAAANGHKRDFRDASQKVR